jgi:hypothetical protein
MSGERLDRPGENGAGYFSGVDNRFRAVSKLCLAAAVTETASTNGPWIDVGDKGTVRLKLDVTAHTAGGDTLDVGIQTSKDRGVADVPRSLGSFTQRAATGSETLSFSGADRFVRYASALAGAGVSVTYSIDGEAV